MINERPPKISKAVLEAVGIALCIAIIGGITSLFHVYNQQKAVIEDLKSIHAEMERQWAQVFKLHESIYTARLDLYRLIYELGENNGFNRYRSEREIHKPER